MARWEPNAPERLVEAALELYSERGYDATTVADIAARVGLTERTYFRYFADKREVLFWKSDELETQMVDALLGAPELTGPLEAVGLGLDAAASLLQARRDFARKRNAVITANAALRERELSKMAGLTAALADALQKRGVKGLQAGLAAEAGVAVFKIAFERWLDDDKQRDFGHHIRKSLKGLRGLVAS